jgi:thiol-disulfide isomerase/thioredoxin
MNEFRTKSKYPHQKIIAEEIYTLLTQKKLDKGSKAVEFSLMNKNNELVSLNSFKGKHLYINFWATWNIPSQKEMKVMEALYKKYNGAVEFLSICTDNNIEKMNNFLAKNPSYTWKFLHLGKNQKLLDDYGVATLPMYVFLDNNLNIISSPAPRPGGSAERATEDNIEKIFYDVMNKK